MVKGIEPQLDDGDTVVWRVRFSRWRKRHLSSIVATDETLWIGLNPQGKPIKAGALETDARWVYVRVEKRQPKHVCATGTTHVRLNGTALFESETPRDLDRAIGAPTR